MGEVPRDEACAAFHPAKPQYTSGAFSTLTSLAGKTGEAAAAAEVAETGDVVEAVEAVEAAAAGELPQSASLSLSTLLSDRQVTESLNSDSPSTTTLTLGRAR